MDLDVVFMLALHWVLQRTTMESSLFCLFGFCKVERSQGLLIENAPIAWQLVVEKQTFTWSLFIPTVEREQVKN